MSEGDGLLLCFSSVCLCDLVRFGVERRAFRVVRLGVLSQPTAASAFVGGGGAVYRSSPGGSVGRVAAEWLGSQGLLLKGCGFSVVYGSDLSLSGVFNSEK